MNLRKVFVIIATCTVLTGCLSQEQKDEQTARQYCGSCHTFPDAKLLPWTTWESSVMPQMSFRMGRDLSQLPTLSKADQSEVLPILPAQSMVTEEEWVAIQRYYQKNAPATLPIAADSGRIEQELKGFTAEQYRIAGFPLHTFTTYLKNDHAYFLGSRLSKLHRMNSQLIATDSFALDSPPSMIISEPGMPLTVLLMGIMDPNDQAAGKLIQLDLQNRQAVTLIDSLRRPVHVSQADLDGDGLSDYIICSFGNYTGDLSAFRNRGDGTFERRVLINIPGARKTIVRDFDNNGKPDIMVLMSQGDERLILLHNQGRFEFRQRTLLTFPPVYGSSYFDLADFNGDGHDDILYTNGDNADYSMVLKPYHGVRIYLNDGKNEFKQSWFYNMHGASEAVADDFDNDGDVDIAAVSFFPPFKAHPELGFIYFEATDTGYVPRTTSLAGEGRWLRINAEDIDDDGDKDLLLTALDFNRGIPEKLLSDWKLKPVSVLLLRNNASQRVP